MITTAHNSTYDVRGLDVRGLGQFGQVDKPISLAAMALDSIYAGRRTWFPDFN